MSEIKKLQPALWEIFYELTQIPRPSKKEEKAVEFANNFGKELGLKTIVDNAGNVIIKKPASPGMENKKTVILQAHLDMVPQKNSDKHHDFELDPIVTRIEDGWVTADGTTLGSDNGIGVAAALSVLKEKDIQHGPVEVLLTIDEETGMTGAFELKSGLLEGEILLNLDSEDEGELYIGCAGGMNTSGTQKYNETATPAGYIAFKFELKGLKGGHSGLDIHLGRGNSNKLMNRFLREGVRKYSLHISSVNGGSLRNAIPRESVAIICCAPEMEEDFLKFVKEMELLFKTELRGVEPDLVLTASRTDVPEKVMEMEACEKMIKMVSGLPHGVMRMSSDMPGVVETSINLALVNVDAGKLDVLCLIRSSVDSAKFDIGEMTEAVMALAGLNVVHDGNYPGWKPDVDSPILETMKNVYENKYSKVPEIKVIHAGLECGIIGDAYPGLDMISFGPTIKYPHSPDEKVNISTVQKFWDYLLETLRNIPEK